MKRGVVAVSFLFAVFVTTVPSAQADWWKKIIPQIAVDSPAIRQVTGIDIRAGIGGGKVAYAGIERYNMVFRNAVPAPVTIRVISYEKEIARLSPGGVAVDDRKSQWINEVIPILGVCEDQNGQYLGVSWGKINWRAGQTGSKPFEFSDCLTPDGSWLVRDRRYGYSRDKRLDYPLSRANLDDHPAHLPRKWHQGTNGLQVFNGSYMHGVVRINGHLLRNKDGSPRLISPLGGFEYLEWGVIGQYGVVRSVQVDYIQIIGGEPIIRDSKRSRELKLSAKDIRGKQLIIGAPSYGIKLSN